MKTEDLWDKWGDRVASGWYGFAIPEEWADVVDGALTAMVQIDPDLSIHQIKSKFGGLRLYVGTEFDGSSSKAKAIRCIELLAEMAVDYIELAVPR